MSKTLQKTLAMFGIAASTLASSPLWGEEGYYGKYEAPTYSVESQLGAAQLRQYDPHLVAVVSVRGDQRGALNRGFQVLAGYIFGGNEDRTSIAMTSPVTQTAPQDGVSEVTFMVPRAWDVDSLPAPNNAAVRFEEVGPRRMLVLTFSGRARGAVLAEKEAELLAIAAAEGLRAAGPVEYAFYDDPMTLPMNRRNEVALPVAD